MRFHVLGPLEVVRDGRPVVVPGIHQRATLGFLLLHPNAAVATSRLLRALWGDEPPVTARKMVQNAVAGLRRTVRDDADVLTRPPGYQLSVRSDQVDLTAFQGLSARGRAELAAGSWGAAADSLAGALACWRGPALADLVEEGLVWPEAAALDSARMVTFEDWAQARLALGQHQELVPELEAAAEAAPLRERLTGQLMVALYRCGRQADALECYRRTRTALVDQLGLDPGHELRRLERAILDHEPWLTPRAAAVLPVHPGGSAPAPAGDRPGRDVQGVAGAGPFEAGAGCGAGMGAGREGGPRDCPEVEQADGPARNLPSPRAQGGYTARKWVSVLAGRLELGTGVETSDPEDVDTVLRAVTARVRAETSRFGGEVYTALGSVWIVVFGLPRTREEDAERAVRAGLAIRRAAAALAKTAAGAGGAGPWDLRMAVTTGEVLATFTDSGAATAAGLSGDVTGRAMRLLASVPSGELRVCEATRAASDGAFTYASVDEHGRGVGGVVGVRTAGLEPAAVDSPAAVAESRRTPFLERDHEKDLLHRLLAETGRRRRPCLVTISGEPGIGKSRLLWEFCREAGEAAVGGNVRFLYGRIGRFPAGPFEVLSDIVRRWAGITAGDSREAAVARLAAAIGMTGATLGTARRAAAELAPLLDPAWPGGEQAPAVLAAWRRVLTRFAAAGPTVLIVEDLHRGDDRLLDVLEGLDEGLGQVPLLVVLSTRPDLLERRTRWAGGKRDATTMYIDQLSEAAIQHLMVDLAVRYGLRPALPPQPLPSGAESGSAGPGPAEPGLAEPALAESGPVEVPTPAPPPPSGQPHECSTVAKVGGNPLFAVALVDMLREVARSAGKGPSPALEIDSAGPVGPASAMVRIPRTVHGVIAAWLDTLPPRTRRVLQGAAVFGATAWAEPVAAACGLPQEEILRELDYLVRRGVLRQVLMLADPDPRYEFRHVFVRDVAYSQIPRAARGRWHLRFARWLGDDRRAGTMPGPRTRTAPGAAAGVGSADAARTAMSRPARAAGTAAVTAVTGDRAPRGPVTEDDLRRHHHRRADSLAAAAS
ncbi:AAA family ATPase [Frankia sp. Cpl3]|uniref:BTAD domain-containing putative transcriptional regulator n=1 Tax=Parafrankia colletiae TaxID=573497 RepID=UPI000AD7F5AF|nr:BTAD domain-containing putative transcriptional regulator [Parafrankia colletiae]MCK9902768.1 AAA family ATPase [Frankia sp. Cpl3]